MESGIDGVWCIWSLVYMESGIDGVWYIWSLVLMESGKEGYDCIVYMLFDISRLKQFLRKLKQVNQRANISKTLLQLKKPYRRRKQLKVMIK